MLRNSNIKLTQTVGKLQKKVSACYCKKLHYNQLLKSSDMVHFYTGIENIDAFNTIFDMVNPVVRKRWSGYKKWSKKITRNFKSIPKRSGPARKLCAKDEMLLCLMKLRLGLTLQDLAHRFKVSLSTASSVLTSWVKGLSTVLRTLIFIPDKESLVNTKPQRFKNITQDIHSIIDATEIFIEIPKYPDNQKKTWSEYKHHNTLKVLISVTPNLFINFVSKAYKGAISEKKLTLKSQYLEKLPMYSTIMADKGFNIENKCLSYNLSLHIPRGKRGTYQMVPSDLIKTKKNCKHKHIVKQVIRQVKTFKILANELPISLIRHIDDVLVICCALVNLKSSIFRD